MTSDSRRRPCPDQFVIFAVASAVLLLLGVLAYRRQLLRPAGVGFLLLRLATLALFGAILVGFRATRTWTARPRHVAVLLDRSASMAAIGADTVLDRTVAALNLPAHLRRDIWSFADSCRRAGPGPDRTRIAAALEQVARTRPAAVILATDGQDNGETPATQAARTIGVPVHTIGFGAAPAQNLAVTRIALPAVIHAGDSADVLVRVVGAGLEPGPVRVRLGNASRSVEMGSDRTELEAQFRHVFLSPGPQPLTASVESLASEATYADNQRTEFADVRPGRYNVVYLTNRPGPSARFIIASLGPDQRVAATRHAALIGGLSVPESEINRADVFIVDGAVERPAETALWEAVARRVRSGAGILILAGPDFKPGPVLEPLLPFEPGPSQTGAFTPRPAPAGRLLPWFAPGEGVDLKAVPPFVGAVSRKRPDDPGRPEGATVWVEAEEGALPLVVSGRLGRGRAVFVSGYPLWRWGFGPHGSALGTFLSGVIRFLAESDTSPFVVEPDKPGFLQGEPVRLTLKAVGPDRRPWAGLDAVVELRTRPESSDASVGLISAVPMVEYGNGVYGSTVAALSAGTYDAVALVSLGDTVVGRAAAQFTVAAQSVELAQLGLNRGLLEAIAAVSGGSFFPAESLAGDASGVQRPASELRLGTYERRFVFEPRRATWAYALVALLAGLEWWLRRKKGLL